MVASKKAVAKAVAKTLLLIVLLAILAALVKRFLFPLLPAHLQEVFVWIGRVVVGLIIVLLALFQLSELIRRPDHKPVFPPITDLDPKEPPGSERRGWRLKYRNLLEIDQYRLAYIPVVNDWWREGTISDFGWDCMRITLAEVPFELDTVFRKTQFDYDFRDDPSCRLSECCINNGQNLALTLHLQETSYGDYLRSGEHLDDPFPDDPRETFRSALASIVEAGGGEVKPEKLTNICGAGIFLVSRDNQIIVTKHSEHSHVYPGRLTFTASGLMKWGAHPHPFMEMARRTFQEIQHQVNPDNVRLIGFGADARKLYFQFSFFEETNRTASEVIARHGKILDHTNRGLIRDRPREMIALPFELEEIRDKVLDDCWEPAAEACILTLCARHFGADKVAQVLHRRQRDWTRRDMKDEWDYRASRKGDLPDMSVRYPPGQLAREKERYVTAVFDFMQDDANDRDVLEIGGGTGRITERLVEAAARVTCVDLCERMIDRNKKRLGSKADKPSYVLQFGQDYAPPKKHQVAVCSLVLLHNVDDSDFRDLVRRICACSEVVFVFEDVTVGRRTSEATYLRPEEDLTNAFSRHGFKVERSAEYMLFDDHIVFLKFVRT